MKPVRLVLFLAGIVLLAACDQTALDTPEDLTPTVTNGDLIPGRYIVVLSEDEAPAGKDRPAFVSDTALEFGVTPERVYNTALAGFSGAMSPETVARLENDDRVAYVEPDRWVVLDPITIQGGDVDTQGPGNGRGKPGGGGGSDPSQTTPYGITRVGGGATYTGSGVAWIIDTGIDLDHADLNVDANRGFSAFTKGKDSGFDDGNGHGTHVAGTVAALDNSIGVIGVAAGATVIPVKVLDRRGSGSYSGVIAGVDFVAANGSSGDVANMSLGGGFSQAVNDAVIAASTVVEFSLAAGNESTDANTKSPASANGNNIYTISAVDSNDNFASFSNYGNPPVDFAAPGVGIHSTWKDGGYNTISGTSMAAPHVAGLLLLGPISNGGTASGDPDGNADTIASN
ncbi:MAG: S8 family serine peptidase [Rhodothermales bacterium]|nr:S8 family serine peptidase [Rhodothermales bacterium]